MKTTATNSPAERVEAQHLAVKLRIIGEDELVARLVQIIEETPLNERAALMDELRGSGREADRVAAQEYEWRQM